MNELGHYTSTEVAESREYVLSTKRIFQIVWKRLWVVALVTTIIVGTAVGYSLGKTDQYVASVKILVGQDRGISATPQEADGLKTVTETIAEAVSNRPMAEAVIRQLDLQVTSEHLLASLSAEQIPDTQFVQVYYRDTDPEKAAQVVNAVGHVFSEEVSQMSPEAGDITVTVWDEAVVPQTPVSPNPLRNGLLALMLGGTLGLGVAFLLEYLDDSWRSPEETEWISGVPTFGVIPQFSDIRDMKGKSKGDQNAF
jgi:capsular polysaccharide biosynthesis protein